MYKFGMLIYRLAGKLFFALGGKIILRRKYRNDISERMGIIQDCPKNCIWVHAVSVGEVQSASSLIHRIKSRTDRPCIISTVTATGRNVAEKLLANDVAKIIYSPWDLRKFVERAIDNIQPYIYITMETELWPEMIAQLHSRNVPIFLANGRISEKSFRSLRRTARFWRGVLSNFAKLMVRFDEDKRKFVALGVPDEKIFVTGDCKVDTLFDRKVHTNQTLGDKWQWLRDGASYLFVAGSTHQGEDDVVVSAFRILLKKFPDAKLVIVPRHPERALMSIASVLPYSEMHAELLSSLESDNSKNCNVVIIDRIGVLFELYAVADSVFIGGSLVQKGGQNPFEPALFGKAAIHGPSMTDFPDTERMDSMGAAICVHNDLELALAWENSVSEISREKAKDSCEKYFATLGGAAEKTWNEIELAINN